MENNLRPTPVLSVCVAINLLALPVLPEGPPSYEEISSNDYFDHLQSAIIVNYIYLICHLIMSSLYIANSPREILTIRLFPQDKETLLNMLSWSFLNCVVLLSRTDHTFLIDYQSLQ